MANYTYLEPSELVVLLDDETKRTRLAVIDCRDDDRSEGFIINSIHAPAALYCEEMYSALAKSLAEEKVEIVVFHCALSQVRGPRGANRFALAQRAAGYALPNIFVLRGGWESFFASYGGTRPDLCMV